MAAAPVRAMHLGGRHGPEPVVLATGAYNGLGFNAHQTWAFWRAEVTDLSESPFVCANGKRATMALARNLTFGCSGVERLLQLALPALDELKPRLMALRSDAKLGLFAGVSERFAKGAEPHFARQRPKLESGLREWLNRAQASTDGPSASSSASPGATGRGLVTLREQGHAAFAFALQEALEQLSARSLDAAIVGGLDTYYDPQVISELLAQDRLYDLAHLDTVIPGEGAAFLLIARADIARGLGNPLARIESVVVAHEPASMFTELPCTAQGLGSAMRAVGQRLKAEKRRLDWVLADVNQEPYRTHEFGLALPRAVAPGGLDTAGKDFAMIAGDTLQTDFMPECFGDLGAATMATAAVLATESFSRGVPLAANCLVTGSSVTEARGAVLLSAAAPRSH